IEKRNTKFILEGSDLLSHGRLRHTQFFCRTTKVQMSGNRPKDFKPEVLHRSLSSKSQQKGGVEVFFYSETQSVQNSTSSWARLYDHSMCQSRVNNPTAIRSLGMNPENCCKAQQERPSR